MVTSFSDVMRGAKRWILGVAMPVLLVSVGIWWTANEVRLWLYGLQAYTYGFPLVMMDLMKQSATAVPSAGEITAPVNQFAVMTRYPDASSRTAVRPGLDMLSATAWADLAREPLVLSVPDAGGRYYFIALFDMWTNVFASIGTRTTGTSAANFLIVGPGWQGTAPADVKQTFRSPTRFVWLNGQMQANGAQDYTVVSTLQRQYKLTPLSAWSKPSPAKVSLTTVANATAAPRTLVQKMDARAYFGRIAVLIKDNPPASVDGSMVEKLKMLGIEPGNDRIDPDAAKGLERAMGEFEKLQAAMEKPNLENGWTVMPKNIGNYGTDYELRAGISLVGLGAIPPQEMVYRTAFRDADDKPLDGASSYVLHFDKDQTPPANATWSISMYDLEGFLVPNFINRHSLAAWMPLKYNDDGSLDLYIQANLPSTDKQNNWLPAPRNNPFGVTVRNYWPKEMALDGTYKIPPIRKMQ